MTDLIAALPLAEVQFISRMNERGGIWGVSGHLDRHVNTTPQLSNLLAGSNFWQRLSPEALREHVAARVHSVIHPLLGHAPVGTGELHRHLSGIRPEHLCQRPEHDARFWASLTARERDQRHDNALLSLATGLKILQTAYGFTEGVRPGTAALISPNASVGLDLGGGSMVPYHVPGKAQDALLIMTLTRPSQLAPLHARIQAAFPHTQVDASPLCLSGLGESVTLLLRQSR